MITKTNLIKERNWTESLINKFLPEPDIVKRNPIYKSASPMRLYELERVEKVEATEGFKIAFDKSLKRKKSSRLVVEKKRVKTMEYVDGVKVSVPAMSKEKLYGKAVAHYNDMKKAKECWHGKENGEYGRANTKADESFLQRIAVNYLRHELTDYEFHLGRVHGRVGTNDAYVEIRKKILEAIAKVYPWLSDECERQE